jgi:hypothetical protein
MASILFGLPEAIVSHQKNKERKVQTQHNHTTSNFGCQDQYGVTLAKNPSLRSELALSVAKGQVLVPGRGFFAGFSPSRRFRGQPAQNDSFSGVTFGIAVPR